MRMVKQNWIACLLLATGLGFTPVLRAQDAGTKVENEATNVEAQAKDATNELQGANDSAEPAPHRGQHRLHAGNGSGRGPLVVLGNNAELKAGETAEAVVVVGGNAKVHGKVNEAVVVVFGDVELDGEVGDAVVAVLGSVKLNPKAVVHGDVVAVGGKLEAADGAKIEGERQEVVFGDLGLPTPQWIKAWFKQCVLKARPLAPQVGWVWAISGIALLFYLLIGALFPRPIAACVSELTERPATTFLIGILTVLLLPFVLIILIVTVVGILVLPFLLAALFLGAIGGKVALLEFLGIRLGRQFGANLAEKPIVALLIGSAVVAVLYLIPIVGLASMLVIGVWSLGGAVLAAFGNLRREIPQKPTTAAPSFSTPFMATPQSAAASAYPVSAMAGAVPMAGAAAAAELAPEPPLGSSPVPPPEPAASTPTSPPPIAPAITPPPPLPDVLSYPRAGFWVRVAAAVLDLILVAILATILSRAIPHLWPLIMLAYFAGMWTWKGTTIGGIVLGLKVVRLDGQSLSPVVAIVRGLAGAFSILVLGLGFLWIAWDKEKQGWHDQIAGTIVLCLPRGTPLVCF